MIEYSVFYTKNFDFDEFTCKCKRCNPGAYIMRLDFIDRLQRLRDCINKPIDVLNGIRCFYDHFYDVCKGDRNKYYESEHQFGNAADIRISKKRTKGDMIRLAEKAKLMGFKRIGFYPGSWFCHLDMATPDPSESWIFDGKTYVYYREFDKALSVVKSKLY